MQKNYGLNLELEKAHQKPKDWVFGATSPKCLAEIQPDKRWEYLPKGEVQRGAEDTMDCATRAPINILETKFSYLLRENLIPPENLKFLIDNGYLGGYGNIVFSDAFVAINSGTTRQGNSLIAPLEAIRKKGLIPKSMLPLEKTMTWDAYHNPARITEKMRKLGEEFADRFTINYEKIYEDKFSEVLDRDLVDTGGYAWPTPISGEYPRTDNDPNHAFILFNKPMSNAFDNYEEASGDFIKKLASNYKFVGHGYRVIISSTVPLEKKLSILAQIINALAKIVGLLTIQIQKPVEPIVEPVVVPEHKSRIDEWALAIQECEGYGTANAVTINKNFNPGAIRNPDGTFKKFSTYNQGYDYLCDYLIRACKGLHIAYPKGGATTLNEFTKIYVGNDYNYAPKVAAKLGISIDVQIKEIL